MIRLVDRCSLWKKVARGVALQAEVVPGFFPILEMAFKCKGDKRERKIGESDILFFSFLFDFLCPFYFDHK